jgi:hypothetical protein
MGAINIAIGAMAQIQPGRGALHGSIPQRSIVFFVRPAHI